MKQPTKNLNLKTDSLEEGLAFIAGVVLLSYGHVIGGAVLLFVSIGSAIERSEKKKKQE